MELKQHLTSTQTPDISRTLFDGGAAIFLYHWVRFAVGTDREALSGLEDYCSTSESHYPYYSQHFDTSAHVLPCTLVPINSCP